MKPPLILAALAAVACTVLLGGTALRTRWLNDETAKQAEWQWAEHCRKYGSWSNNVIYGWSFNTNVVVEIGCGTNRQTIEFGFREDGVVVWRKH